MPRQNNLNRRALLAAAGTVAAGALAGCTSRTDQQVHPDADVVTRDDATTVVTDLDGIRRALGSASPGDVVFVPPSKSIDLGGTWMIEVPEKVTLAGGRGQPAPPGKSSGALLYSPDGDEGPEGETKQKFRVRDGGRFTGFRLRGHHHDYVNPDKKYGGNHYAHRGGGVHVEGAGRVDNNEVFDWVHASVAVDGPARVDHNYIHHNAWDGLGYGVAVGPTGMPDIEHNYFNYNRHSITGTGDPETSYRARYNVVGPKWVGAQFDVHGTDGMSGVAGRRFVFRHNTFKASSLIPEKTDYEGQVPAIHVRGTPKEGIRVEKNWFYHATRSGAYSQSGGRTKVTFSDNHYGSGEPSKKRVGAPRSHDGVL